MKYFLSLLALASISFNCVSAEIKENEFTMPTPYDHDLVTVVVSAKANNYSGFKDSVVVSSATHDIKIVNKSYELKTFKYTYTYCTHPTKSCAVVSATVNVRAKSTWIDHFDSYAHQNYEKEGSYDLIATTMVEGEINKKTNSWGVMSIR